MTPKIQFVTKVWHPNVSSILEGGSGLEKGKQTYMFPNWKVDPNVIPHWKRERRPTWINRFEMDKAVLIGK